MTDPRIANGRGGREAALGAPVGSEGGLGSPMWQRSWTFPRAPCCVGLSGASSQRLSCPAAASASIGPRSTPGSLSFLPPPPRPLDRRCVTRPTTVESPREAPREKRQRAPRDAGAADTSELGGEGLTCS